MTHAPTHGWTKRGQAVHAKTSDHHPATTPYQRFNKTLAVAITNNVGTMTSAYCFCVLALFSLPAVLSGFHVFHSVFPKWLIAVSVISLVAWIAQTFLQLVLLPIIIVGQNVQSEASDARAAKTFEDVETANDRLSMETAGGIKDLHDSLIAYIDSKFVAPIPKKPNGRATPPKGS